MGGVAEETVEQKQKTADGTFESLGRIRFHESNGEVHFHDDDRKLKVAVPVATWWQAWQSLSTGVTKKVELTDPQRKTAIKVKVTGRKGVRDITVRITNVAFSTEFDKLQKFSTRS